MSVITPAKVIELAVARHEITAIVSTTPAMIEDPGSGRRTPTYPAPPALIVAAEMIAVTMTSNPVTIVNHRSPNPLST
jgi:hypothetical protein